MIEVIVILLVALVFVSVADVIYARHLRRQLRGVNERLMLLEARLCETERRTQVAFDDAGIQARIMVEGEERMYLIEPIATGIPQVPTAYVIRRRE